MNSNNREKIFKSWSGISEVALIKEVATKGDPNLIQLCIEYWAKKRQMPAAEYRLFFHDVVQTYVQRLLNERLVFKAENVLKNVQREVKPFYYQFACECDDEELRETVIDYLRKGDSAKEFDKDLQTLRFYWDVMQELKSTATVMAKFKKQVRRFNMDMMMSLPASDEKRLLVELYFANRNAVWLPRLCKFAVWNYLVESQMTSAIVQWCCCVSSNNNNSSSNSGGDTEIKDAKGTFNELAVMYGMWPIETEMFEFALRTLDAPTEPLRDCFAQNGYFFANERDSVARVLKRVCSTGSFAKNQELLDKLPIGRYLLEKRLYTLMLQSFVSSRELEELSERNSVNEDLLKFIATLKDTKLEEREGFEKIAYSTKVYLESQGCDFQNEQPLVTFHEFLCNEPTIANLNCFLLSSALKHIPYLKSLASRMDSNLGAANRSNNLPTPYDLLRKFRQLDFKELTKDSKDVPSFSNERLCQKYARKYHLNYLHYLKQQRSAYAVYYLLTEKLQHYAQITNAQLFSACETVTEMALQNATNTELVTHAVAFIEMLGFDSQNLRVCLKLCRLIDGSHHDGLKINYTMLIGRMETLLVKRLREQQDNDTPGEQFPLTEYAAVMRMAACNQQQCQWPDLVLSHFATEDNWWRLLVLMQYFEVPLNVLQQLLKHFECRAVGEHMLRALSFESSAASTANERFGKRHASFSRQHGKPTRKQESSHLTTSYETIASSISTASGTESPACAQSKAAQCADFTIQSDSGIDLFAIILMSKSSIPEETIRGKSSKFLELIQDNSGQSTSWNLMRYAIKYRLPVLSVLSATVFDENLEWNWLIWLAVSTDQWQDVMKLMLSDTQEFAWALIENCVRLGCTATLYRSFCIFYKDNQLIHFLRFLHCTQNQRDFSEDMVHELRLYLIAWSKGQLQVPLCKTISRESLMQRSIKLLLTHMEHNFCSTIEQQKYLGVICRSDISDISNHMDFCLLQEIFGILQNITGWVQKFPLPFERLIQADNKIYDNLLAALREAKAYQEAVRLATLLHLPISNIVYTKWVADIENGNACTDEMFQRCEDEILEHSLPPEILINFFLYAAARLESTSPDGIRNKYHLLKRALNVIKKNHLFPNESFDRDQIEYEMIVYYLQINGDDEIEPLDIYHSEYYEEIMLKERCVLYKSFLELKELAGVEDLHHSVGKSYSLTEPMRNRLESLLNRLLDEGDIVEALRLQELFECRPIDLRFVVFCMALAEGVTTIFNMSSDERNLLRDIEKGSFAKFNKRTLSTIRTTMSHSPGHSASPLKVNNELSDSCSTLEFEEIPSKEKRETLDTIQGIASKLKHGINIAKRIVMAYRAAMYLDKEYLDVLRTKDVSVLLKSVAEEEGLHRLLVVSDILTSNQMTAQEIADLLAFEITTAVVRPRFYIFNADQHTKNTFTNADLWGCNIDRDLHLFLELTQNSTLLGSCLLEYCDALKAYRKYQDDKPYIHSPVFEKLADIITRYGLPTTTTPLPGSGPPQVLSHKKQNLIYVELLIKAHECFVHECSTEGISNVLHRTKILNVVLARAKSWSLIVRMLIGIARYREMFYCFDTLIENEQFESLLGQFDEEKTVGLRQAIITYIREYSPENGRELLKLSALHFRMYKDLAEMWEQDAVSIVEKVLALAHINVGQLTEQFSMVNLGSAVPVKTTIPKMKSSSSVVNLLQQAMENYSHATENYLMDNRLLLAQKSVAMAELMAMQIDLATKGLDKGVCVCVLKLHTHEEFRELVNAELSIPQSIILGRAYGYDINWAEAILSQYVILRKSAYLNEYLRNFLISDSIIDNIVKGFHHYLQYHTPSVDMDEKMAHLVAMVKSITLKYKLASMLSLKTILSTLINDQTSYYLRDTNYGRNEQSHIC